MNLSFAPPPTDELQAYAQQLFERRESAVIVEPATAEIGEWTAQPNLCHENARIWSDNREGFAAINGWFVMNLGKLWNKHCTRFVAHSVVRDEDGKLWDITPNAGTTQNYPFLTSEVDEETYFRFETILYEQTGQGNLNHFS